MAFFSTPFFSFTLKSLWIIQKAMGESVRQAVCKQKGSMVEALLAPKDLSCCFFFLLVGDRKGSREWRQNWWFPVRTIELLRLEKKKMESNSHPIPTIP